MVSDEVRLTDLLRIAERRIARRVERTLEASGLSIDQWRVLRSLSDGAGQSMSVVARAAMLPAPSLTKIVDRLVERGLVYRKVGEPDRRRVLIFISGHGCQVLAAVDGAVGQEERVIIGEVGLDDGTELLALLDRVVTQLDERPVS